jgi:hypothetical protein
MNACADSRRPSGQPQRTARQHRWVAPAAHAIAVAALIAGAIAAAPALAARPAKPKPRAPVDSAVLSTLDALPSASSVGRFAFTAPGAAAQSHASSFRFTPSGEGARGRTLTLGVAARVTTPLADRSRAAAPADRFVVPSSYGLNLSVGWKGFALDTGYSHAEPALAAPVPGRMTDQLALGLSYGGEKWRTRLGGAAEQGLPLTLSPLALSPLTRRYSLELGGAYQFAPRLSVTGGVRYRIAPEPPTLLMPNRDDQAVYLGTQLAF